MGSGTGRVPGGCCPMHRPSRDAGIHETFDADIDAETLGIFRRFRGLFASLQRRIPEAQSCGYAQNCSTLVAPSHSHEFVERKLEARAGIEPAYTDLQSAASPLRHRAIRWACALRRSAPNNRSYAAQSDSRWRKLPLALAACSRAIAFWQDHARRLFDEDPGSRCLRSQASIGDRRA